jgi:hypothetical protein
MLSVAFVNAVSEGSATFNIIKPRDFIRAGTQVEVTPHTATSSAYGSTGSGIVQTGSTAQTKVTSGN